MEVVSTGVLAAAIEILGAENTDDDEVDFQISTLVDNAVTARRLADWPPEAFGIVLISRACKVTLPKTFFALNAKERWVEFSFDREPLFGACLLIAQDMYHKGPRDTFENVSRRSSMLHAVRNALEAGDSVDGGILVGPAFIGIPAEVYQRRWRFW